MPKFFGKSSKKSVAATTTAQSVDWSKVSDDDEDDNVLGSVEAHATNSGAGEGEKGKIDWVALSDNDDSEESNSSAPVENDGKEEGGAIDWDALSDDEDDGKSPAGGLRVPAGGVDWDALDSDEDGEEKPEKAGGGTVDWDNLDSDEEGGEEDEEESSQGGGNDNSGFDYLDALLSDDEEEIGTRDGDGVKKEGKVDWDNLDESDGEVDEETKKRDEQLKARIFAALNEEFEEEQEFQKQQEQKKREKEEAAEASKSTSSSKKKTSGFGGGFARLRRQSMTDKDSGVEKIKSGKSKEKDSKGNKSSTSSSSSRPGGMNKLMLGRSTAKLALPPASTAPKLPSYVVSYVADEYLKSNDMPPKPVKQGYLNKTGPSKGRHSRKYNRRWCVLYRDSMMYYEKFGDSEPKGTFSIKQVQSVRTLAGQKGEDKNIVSVAFEVVLPERVYHFVAESEREQREWLRTLQMAASAKVSDSHLNEEKGGGSGEIIFDIKCEGNRKIIKCGTNLTYKDFNKLVVDKFSTMLPSTKDYHIYMTDTNCWLSDRVKEKDISTAVKNSTQLELRKR